MNKRLMGVSLETETLRVARLLIVTSPMTTMKQAALSSPHSPQSKTNQPSSKKLLSLIQTRKRGKMLASKRRWSSVAF